MEPFQYHVYVCNQKKPEGIPSCSAHGSVKLIDLLRQEVMKQGLGDKVQITTCGSIGLCERGPNMIVYPEGIWYSGVTAKDIPEIVSNHFKADKPVERLVNDDVNKLREEINFNKSRMIAALQAQDKSGMLPLDLMEQIQGYRASRIILTAVELDIFTAVGEKATFDEVAGKINTDPRATEMFLNALVALELLDKKDIVYTNTAVSKRYLMEGSPDDSRASLMHTVTLWDRWSNLTECVRTGTAVGFKEMADRGDKWTIPFIAAMHKNASARASQIVNAVNADNVKKVLDVGGGSGAYSIAFAKANQDLRAVIFDLPDVTKIAQAHIDEAGVTDRVTTKIGDFRTDEFDQGYDLVFISAIAHMNSPQVNIDLFKKSYDALVSGGRVVIQDFILGPEKTSPQIGTLFALNMLVGTKAGSSYSETEYDEWLKEVGFKKIQLIRLPGPTALIFAFKE